MLFASLAAPELSNLLSAHGIVVEDCPSTGGVNHNGVEMSNGFANESDVHDRYDTFVSRLQVGGRNNVERHLANCERECTQEHIRLWKRLVGFMASLTPNIVPVAGARAVQFYIVDGKYRQQVFALEDLRQDDLALYTGDVLTEATSAGILLPSDSTENNTARYGLREAPEEQLQIERLTTASTSSAPDYYRHMLGWNRKALRIKLPVIATRRQIAAAEQICRLAADRFAHQQPKAAM